MKIKTLFSFLLFAFTILTWTACTKEGNPGKDGSTILSGSGDPDVSIGNDGDFYIDTADFVIYGPKTEGDWGSGTVIIGPAGTANVIYSSWFSPSEWLESANNYYFEVSADAIDQSVMDNGVVLAYAMLTNDITPNTVRPLPTMTGSDNAFWNYFISDVGVLRFTSTKATTPSLNNMFRYVIIPGGSEIGSKSAKLNRLDVLKKLPYAEVCKMLRIPK